MQGHKETKENRNIEEKILRVFLYNDELKFSDIEKSLGERSNKIAYHVRNLVKKGVLEKPSRGEKGKYKLTETAETLIPYLSEKNSPLPVLLIALGKNSNQVFLYKRSKRPFKNKLSLPGGRMLQGESISDAVKRIMKSKHNIEAKFEKVNSVSLEHVYKNTEDKKIHSFFLIFVKASLDDFEGNKKTEYIDLSKNKNRIIESDYKLVRRDFNKKEKKVNIEEFFTRA